MKRVIRSNKDLADFQAAVKDRINYLEEEDVNSTIRINAAEDEDNEDEDEDNEEYDRHEAYESYISDIRHIAAKDADNYGLNEKDKKSFVDAVANAAEDEGWFDEYDDSYEPPVYEDARADYDASDAVYDLKEQYEME